MTSSNRFMLAAALALVVATPALRAEASDNPAMDAAVSRVEHEWDRINYQVSDPRAQSQQIKALANEADLVAVHYPGNAEPLIWEGIVKSKVAAMSGGLDALANVDAARRLFEAAYKLDRAALDASAPASLGTLYNRVPGFPIGFGDKVKARRYFVEAVTIAPDSMDANYFYGGFLIGQGEYAEANRVLRHALASPPHTARPIWDAGRRAEIRALLVKVTAKLKAAR